MAGSIQVTKQTQARFGAGFTIGDLRAFVDACDGVADGTRVTVAHHESRDQRDSSTTTITVHGAA